MADGDVSVKIKLGADISGSVQSRQELEKLRQSSKKTTDDATKGFDGLSKSVGFFRKALTGFGVAGLFTAIYQGVAKIADSFKAASKQAEALDKIQNELAKAKGLQQLVSAYERLKSAAAAAASEQSHALQMIDERVGNRRRLDNAKLEQDKLAAIAALDPNAPDYAEQKAKIEADYAARSAAMNSSNAREDIVLARQKLDAEAAGKEKEAEAEDAATAVARKKLAEARVEKSKADIEAVDLNENDKTGVVTAIGKTLAQLFTGDWGRMSGATTAEGDQARQNAAKRAADLELRIAELEEEVRKSEERAASLRKDASNLRERHDAMGGALEAADLEGKNAMSSARASEAEASRSLAKKQKDIHAESEKNAAAMTAAENLARAEADLKSRIAEEQSKKDSASQSVYQAQNAVDLARANGQPVGSLTAELQAAQSAANDINFAADKAINALTETLKRVEAQLKAASDHIKKSSSATQYAWEDGNAGGS